jgi:hypothetical protein
LVGYERSLNRIRDGAIQLRSKAPSSREADDFLTVVQETIRQSRDLATVCGELQDLARDKGGFLYNVARMTPVDPKAWDARLLVPNTLRGAIFRGAQQLIATDRTMRDLVVAYGTALSTAANLRLQRRVTAVSVIAVVVAIFSAVIAVMTMLFNWPDQSLVRHLLAWLFGHAPFNFSPGPSINGL